MSDTLTASMEDYLETVLGLAGGRDGAHVKDIAKHLGVTMPSVTGALHSLAERKLVNYRPYGTVTLTERGRREAETVRRRHKLLTGFFEDILGLGAHVAEESACRVEHAVGDEVLGRLASYMELAEKCPLGACRWDGGFRRLCEGHGRIEVCEECLDRTLTGLRTERKGITKVEQMTLDRIKPGQRAKIVKVRVSSGAANKRIVDMGMTRGTMVEVERVAPLGDPIEVKLRGYHLSLRKEEARGISVELQV
ncbi:MAG: metal-dependent transcriptional regulator [Candidatus Brocadiia bacterium]|jgi:DtxR family Mn-dependent transcriptional regulator|nr:metal-dependent transcriptional regulator [Candidatus Brocadiia bacterium]